MWDGPAHISYLGQTLAHGFASCQGRGPVITYVLTFVLPAPSTYEFLAKS